MRLSTGKKRDPSRGGSAGHLVEVRKAIALRRRGISRSEKFVSIACFELEVLQLL